MTDAPATQSAARMLASWSSVFESNDVEQSRAHVSSLLSPHALEHRGFDAPPLFQHRHADCGALGINELRYTMFGGDARIAVPDMPDIYLFEINLHGASEVDFGARSTAFKAGQLYVVNAGSPHVKRWCTDGRQIIIKIPQPRLELALSELIGRAPAEPVHFAPSPRPVDSWTASLANLVHLIRDDLERGGHGLVRRNAANSAERLLLQLLLETVPNNYTGLLLEPPERPKPAHVRRAIDFIHANAAEPIGMAQISAAAGVSARALYDGFRKFCGLSPMAYLRSVRLSLAREALERGTRAGSESGTTVTDVALASGFSHLSKFARAYRERYGELPSETLARRR